MRPVHFDRPVRRAALAGGLLLSVAALAGCTGGGDSDADSSTDASAQASESTEEVSEETERLLAVLETQADFENVPSEAFGVIPEGLPAGVLPADQDANYVVGMGEATSGWVVFVYSTQAAADAQEATAARLSEAGYVEGEPVTVPEEELIAPEDADPAGFGELRTFAADPVLVGFGVNDLGAADDEPIKSLLMLVVSPGETASSDASSAPSSDSTAEPSETSSS